MWKLPSAIGTWNKKGLAQFSYATTRLRGADEQSKVFGQQHKSDDSGIAKKGEEK
jgi:hypothetical protein